MKNGWLDPTVVGNFEETAVMPIRSSLSLQDSPTGLPGSTFPRAEDLRVLAYEFPITAGDTLAIEVYELRERFVPFAAQVEVTSAGYVNLPVVGKVNAQGLTVPEFEEALEAALVDRQILLSPEVTVNPVFLQEATYSIFGIGVSAANNAPLRAGTFPIRRPDLNLLEAINQVGGLNEFVTDIYVFRHDDPGLRSGQLGDSAGADSGSADPPADSRVSNAVDDSAVEPDAVSDLLRVVDEGSADVGDPVAGTDPPDSGGVIDPYIWVGGEFVPNPAYRGVMAEGEVVADASGMATPAVNWARIAGDSSFRMIRVPADLLRSGDPRLNIIVRPGDVIRILSGEIGVYYVMGQVVRVGAFAFNSEQITLKSAIAAAGGLSPLAWPDRCTVYRRLGQREQMIQVDLDAIFAGKDSDFLIRRGDIINVGTHPFAPFLQRIRAWTLPNPVNNVGYSFTYARNFADIDSYSARINPDNRPDTFPGLLP